MSKKDKLLRKFLARPPKRNLTYPELRTLLESLGYREIHGQGSRVSFYHEQLDDIIDLHQPHPGNELKLYQVRLIQQKLREIVPVLQQEETEGQQTPYTANEDDI